jgi:hypothetical protein
MKFNIKFLPWSFLAIFCIHTMIKGLDLASMGVILGLCTLAGFIEYKENSKIIKDVQNNMNLLFQQNEILKKEVGDIKSHITASKMISGMQNPLRKA